MQVYCNGKQETKAKLQPACILDDDYTYSPDLQANLPALKKGDIQHTVKTYFLHGEVLVVEVFSVLCVFQFANQNYIDF